MFEWDRDALPFGVTAVENRFVMEYLPAAKGDFVKVYLWGLFACAHKDADYALETMAQDLMMAVSDVEAALRYWERRGLVSRISEKPPQYRFYSPRSGSKAAAPCSRPIPRMWIFPKPFTPYSATTARYRRQKYPSCGNGCRTSDCRPKWC